MKQFIYYNYNIEKYNEKQHIPSPDGNLLKKSNDELIRLKHPFYVQCNVLNNTEKQVKILNQTLSNIGYKIIYYKLDHVDNITCHFKCKSVNSIVSLTIMLYKDRIIILNIDIYPTRNGYGRLLLSELSKHFKIWVFEPVKTAVDFWKLMLKYGIIQGQFIVSRKDKNILNNDSLDDVINKFYN